VSTHLFITYPKNYGIKNLLMLFNHSVVLSTKVFVDKATSVRKCCGKCMLHLLNKFDGFLCGACV